MNFPLVVVCFHEFDNNFLVATHCSFPLTRLYCKNHYYYSTPCATSILIALSLSRRSGRRENINIIEVKKGFSLEVVKVNMHGAAFKSENSTVLAPFSQTNYRLNTAKRNC